MNARLYDPTIGRFLSADTFIQDPYDSQSYNRYSYVRNNPLKYVDPTGHFFSGLRHWVSRNWRAVVTIAVVAVVTIATGGAAALGIAGLGWSPVAVGAAAGFAGGFTSTMLNGGSFRTALRNGAIGGVMGAVTAGFAQGIGNFADGASSWMGVHEYTAGVRLATRAVLHGALSSFMSKARGGEWSAGFWSGAVGTTLGSVNTGNNYFVNVAKNAIISGTVSEIMGGKFSNGAALGAFRYMFNDALHEKIQKFMPKKGNWVEEKYPPLKFFNTLARRILAPAPYVEPEFKFPDKYYRGMGMDMFDRMSEDAVRGWGNAPRSFRGCLDVAGLITLPAVAYGMTETYLFTMANPRTVIFVGEVGIPVADNLFMGGTAPAPNIPEVASFSANYFGFSPWVVK